jgi:predicted  nucleic acid-binding Zn-ribbon protein
MRRAQRLLELQQTDLALDAARKRVRQIEAQLAESDALRTAREDDRRLRGQLEQLRVRSKDLELQSTTLDNKIKSVDDRLYGGSVRNPRELSDLQRDAASLRRHKSELDDTLLNVMLDIEQAEQAHLSARAELARVEAGWQSDQATLLDERAGLQKQTAELDARRAAQRAEIQPADLATYDQLRVKRHGTAVAQLDDGVCGVCGVQPSDSKLAHLRRDDALLTCGNCERILLAF